MELEEDYILEALEKLDKERRGGAVKFDIRELSKAYKNPNSFIRKIGGDKRGRLFIYLANEKLLKDFGFSKGDLVKVELKPNKIIIEKIQ